METKNMETLVEVLVEKIRGLQLDLNLMRYERDDLKKANERLTKEVEELKWHLNPLVKMNKKEGNDNA